MTDSQRLQVALRGKQARVSALLAQDTRSTDEQGELRTLASDIADVQSQLAAAEAAEAVTLATSHTPTMDAETRERVSLRNRSSLGSFLLAALQGRLPGGSEAEYMAACHLSEGIPIDLWESDRQQRHHAAVTPAPATGTGVAVAPVQPFVFAPSIAPRLGIDMPQVSSGGYSEMTISTHVPAAPKIKGADADDTAGVLTAVSANPRRISARMSLTMEDIASIGVGNFEAALRQNASMALSDAYDTQCITGDGQSPNVNGLINQLAAVSDPQNKYTLAGVLADVGSQIDGLWASMLKDLAIVVNPDTYGKFAADVFTGTDETLAGHLTTRLAAFYTNKRMPATDTTIAQGIVYRMGQRGIRTASHPTWGAISIDDIYTSSRSGQRHFSMHVLVGDKVLMVQPDAYDMVKVKVA